MAAPTLADSASQFGVQPDPDIDPNLLKPVPLSPTTRRLSMREQQQFDGDHDSVAGRMDAKRQADLLAQDAAEDLAWNRHIETQKAALDWENKVTAQRHGANMIDALQQLRPDAPDYLPRVSKLIADNPLAPTDPRISQILKANDAVFTQAESARKEWQQHQNALESAALSRQESQANREESRQATAEQSKADWTARKEFEIEQKVAALSPDAQSKFAAAKDAGQTHLAAFGEAMKAGRTEITARDAMEAGRQIRAIDANIKSLLADRIKAFQPEEKAAIDKQIEDYKSQRELEDAVYQGYRSTKTVPGQKPGAPVKPTRAPVESILPK